MVHPLIVIAFGGGEKGGTIVVGDIERTTLFFGQNVLSTLTVQNGPMASILNLQYYQYFARRGFSFLPTESDRLRNAYWILKLLNTRILLLNE